MAVHRLFVLVCALTLSGLAAGCIGGGDSDTASADSPKRRTRASRGIFSFGKKKDRAAEKEELARANAAVLDGYTPESSMARDMRTLQDQEQNQARLVARLAETRGTSPDILAQEQERLFALRDKIRNYDTALQRFEMAARTRPARDADMRPAMVPAEKFQDYAVQPSSFSEPAGGYDSYQASRGDGRLDNYDRVTHAKVNLNDGYAQQGEQILYRAEGNDNLAAYYQNTGSLPGLDTGAYNPARQPEPARAPAGPAPTRFAGAPVGRSNFGKNVRVAAGSGTGKPWEEEGGHLFDARAAQAAEKQKTAVPNIYASRPQREEETLWPAGMAMVPPAGARQSALPAPKTEVRLTGSPAELRPAAPATLTGSVGSAAAAKPASKPAAAPVIPDSDVLDDEVFSPSMFLGAGLPE